MFDSVYFAGSFFDLYYFRPDSGDAPAAEDGYHAPVLFSILSNILSDPIE